MLLVEQCLEKVSSPFFLISIASQRVSELSKDANFSGIDKKKALIALEEIANGDLDPQEMYARLVQSFRKVHFSNTSYTQSRDAITL